MATGEPKQEEEAEGGGGGAAAASAGGGEQEGEAEAHEIDGIVLDGAEAHGAVDGTFPLLEFLLEFLLSIFGCCCFNLKTNLCSYV